jgi:hypothetical protein
MPKFAKRVKPTKIIILAYLTNLRTLLLYFDIIEQEFFLIFFNAYLPCLSHSISLLCVAGGEEVGDDANSNDNKLIDRLCLSLFTSPTHFFTDAMIFCLTKNLI